MPLLTKTGLLPGGFVSLFWMALVADGFCDALPFGHPRPQPSGRGLIFGFYHFCLARWCPSLSWRLLSVVDFFRLARQLIFSALDQCLADRYSHGQ
jgi:hypothetical protein